MPRRPARFLIPAFTGCSWRNRPGSISQRFRSLAAQCALCRGDIRVAYNRRFYGSVLAAESLIAEDGGPTSFQFEFTEWSHQIAALDRPAEVKRSWFMANSSHVLDLAFFLGGKPRELSAYRAGGLEWHPSGSVYAGAGVAENGALFSYGANWESAGRWGVEVLTRKRRFIFRPMEKLQVQERGSLAIAEMPDADTSDSDFKPGLYKMVRAFFSGEASRLPSLEEHATMAETFERIRTGLGK